ncbi:MAG TPA: thiamine-phosphate kinase [Mycobacteriales bacterium]|nr:thiamine-phosphate kinase [Mycobacteriales bacterium]
MTLADIGEFALIERIIARLPSGPGIVLGPGDDAAVVRAPDGRVVATTDLLVEDVHFDRDLSSGYDVGRKAAAQNLADVAAMGAAPTALLVGLAAPAALPVAWAEALADGLRDEAMAGGAAVAGGDVVRCDRLVVSVTALGDLAGRAPVTRAGARPGDVVLVVGRLGWAAAGLAVLRAGLGHEPDLARLAQAHRQPVVAYPAALQLAEAGASSMIDVSDGLARDLGHVATRSAVRIELSAADLPMGPELATAAARLGIDPLSWLAGGGDDHAFAATLSDQDARRVAVRIAGLARPWPVTQVGRVLAGSGLAWIDREPPGAPGHEHFADPG